MTFRKFAAAAAVACVSLSVFGADSSAYVGKDHLIAWWDGIDNSLDESGNRSHDEAATVWCDLSGNGHDITGLTAYGSFMSDMFKKTASCKNKSEQKFGLTAKTFEVVVDVSGYSSGWIVPLSTTDTYFISLQKKDGKTLSMFYGNKNTKAPNCYGLKDVPWPEGDKILISCSTDGVIFLNGEKMSSNYTDYWGANGDNVFCGSSASHGSTDVVGYGVSAIRMYDAVLSDEDRICNAQVDRARFIDSSNLLIVAGSPKMFGEVSPAYGSCLVSADEVTCTAPATVQDPQAHATLRGWELFRGGEETPSETGVESPAVFTTADDRMILRWLWDSEFLLSVKQTANGTVTAKEGWYAAGEEVELTATADDGYVFSGWTGDVPAANRLDNPLTLTMDRARSVSAQFDDASALYVDYNDPNAADDASHGTALMPWKTAAYAAGHAPAGKTVILRRGIHKLGAAFSITNAITMCGEGGNGETVLDGANQAYKVTVSGAGALLHTLTLARIGGQFSGSLALELKAEAIVSNVVIRTCGTEFADGINSNCRVPLTLSKGLFTSSWITNNYTYGNCGAMISGTGVMENCYVADNKTRMSAYHDGCIKVTSGDATVRNCTIVDNKLEQHAALYVTAANAKIYNNIIWSNVNYNDATAAANVEQNGSKNWYGNCADPIPGTAEKGNIGGAEGDPKLLADRMHFSSDSPCRGAAVAEYATAFDLDGNPRGASPSIGAFEYVQSDEMLVSISCAALGQLPDGIPLLAVVDGTYTEPLTYVWSYKGDGTVDSEEQNPVIREQGYFQPTLVVTDAIGKTAGATVASPLYIHAAGVTTFYVDYENGSDENAGLSKMTAWKTVPFAIGNPIVFANDVVVLMKGTHPLGNGASIDKQIVLCGEGAKEESVLDGQGKANQLDVKGNGALVHSLTLTNFKDANSECLALALSGNSVVSNVVFHGNGTPTAGNCRIVISQSAGLLTHCWVTNNACAGNAGIVLDGGIAENCAFLDNLSDGGNTGGKYPEDIVRVNGGTFRNNTVANNRTKTVGAVNAGNAAKVYNNIIWGNVDYQDESVDHNWSVTSGGSTANWKNNCTTRIADLAGKGNIEEDPLFVDGMAPAIRPVSPCRNKGDNALGATSATDLLGNPRIKGRKIDMGCVEEPLGLGLGILVR